jgi:hypothetical protein
MILSISSEAADSIAVGFAIERKIRSFFCRFPRGEHFGFFKGFQFSGTGTTEITPVATLIPRSKARPAGVSDSGYRLIRDSPIYPRVEAVACREASH